LPGAQLRDGDSNKTVKVRVTKKPKPAPTKTVMVTARPRVGSGGGTDRLTPAARRMPPDSALTLRGVDPEYDWYIDRDHDGLACER
jgi:micrococcal nuclease